MNKLYKKIIERHGGSVISYLFYRKDFRRTYNFLQESEWWSKKQIETYQQSQLKKLMNHAYTNVPYYKKLFDKHGLKPSDINNFEDLQKIPFLTKEIVRENVEYLKARNYPKNKFEYFTSGGSTEVPLGFYVEKFVRYSRDLAFTQMTLNQVDCNITDKFVDIRSYIIKSKNRNKFWEYSLFGRCLLLSSFHMNKENLPKYVKKIKKFGPKFIIAFPSTITLLAGYMKRNNIGSFPSVKVVVCMSESLYDWQRELLEQILCCKIVSLYGHAEQSALAATCEKSNYYHFFPSHGFIELIGKDGEPVKKEDEIGEIVATGFNNYIFPFIRYRTGDLGVYTSEKCSCGRNYPLLKNIFGRIQEYFVTKDNKYISMTTLTLNDSFDNARQAQFYQEKKGEAILHIVKTEKYTDKDTEKIRKELSIKLGKDFDITIEFVDDIKRSIRGKHSHLIQKIPLNLEDILKK